MYEYGKGDHGGGTVIIARRADDMHDPRLNQPLVKTKARELPVHAQLLEETEEYILGWRSQYWQARKHDFLFVTNGGNPLSISGFNKIFITIKEKYSDVFRGQFFAHLLRHTWNDLFSELMNEREVAESVEVKARAYLMGWSETSQTAALYTKRHIRKRANEASLELQRRIIEPWKS